jgi:hypothetical protein
MGAIGSTARSLVAMCQTNCGFISEVGHSSNPAQRLENCRAHG